MSAAFCKRHPLELVEDAGDAGGASEVPYDEARSTVLLSFQLLSEGRLTHRVPSGRGILHDGSDEGLVAGLFHLSTAASEVPLEELPGGSSLLDGVGDVRGEGELVLQRDAQVLAFLYSFQGVTMDVVVVEDDVAAGLAGDSQHFALILGELH